MNVKRILNFSAGPSMLPLEVLQKAQAEMLNYHDSGMSVMEMSHRSKVYETIIHSVMSSLRSLMNIPDSYKVLLMQGGASLQFSMVPMNLMRNGKADYIVSGYFANKAYQEAQKYGNINLAGTSKDKNYSYIPKGDQLQFDDGSDYVYLCGNNTIYGTQWHDIPDTKGKIIVADMSSEILSREIDVTKYGIIFAGAQKNMGCAGLSVVIIREDLMGHALSFTPTMMDYQTISDKDSMYNTPPTYAIYILGLVLDYLKGLGGLKVVEEQNEKKAKILYDYLDASNFYTNDINKEDRSLMNVTFHTKSVELDTLFVKKSIDEEMSNLKGHRAVGGMRASLYNAMSVEGVKKLVAFMKRFEEENS